MLTGIERLVDLTGPQQVGLTGKTLSEVQEAVRTGDVRTLAETDGHFAVVAREGQTVRLARTIGVPLRYFVAKMFHGPFLIVAERIDRIFEWCREHKIGWQFDPLYTRMVPAHYLIEIEQIGCPDPAPNYHRFFHPPIETGPTSVEACGVAYVQAAYQALKHWLGTLPPQEPVAIAFSGGIDSTSVLLMAYHALEELGRNPQNLRAFTLDLGGGADTVQAEQIVTQLGLRHIWEPIERDASRVNLEEAIQLIEDYHPLDVQCAAMSICLLEGIRERYPHLKYLLDGDGGDENLKDYPLEDSDLTLSSVLRNPLLYQEGWGVDAIKHSLTYSGGLSRSYVRTFAPAARYGFHAFSPYTVRSVIAASTAIPFSKLIGNDVERLYNLKAEVVRAGIRALIRVDMPTPPKRRFQDGVSDDSYRHWRVGKGWCRQVFLRQWQERLKDVWDDPTERISGNDTSIPLPSLNR
ncbi:MAG TPA: asparagine synthase-related protein [Chthonomonas sp.]|uniref:asparagine synthase-related protein n=1 Tax=Chthonomonas sp. TaxID=2282153 RepID=UPI002B4ADDB8|nr:asparagine synthase-related protein [Chthonomonas sp.]HLH80066.1 asparagine synthase-related protein [Chthonomonas sp.]